MKKLFISFLTIFLFMVNAFSQKDTIFDLFKISPADSVYVEIETTRGNVYSGLIVNTNPKYIELETEPMVILRIPRLKVLDYEILDKDNFRGGDFYFENPHATRYFYGPNGYGLKKGTGYYQNLWVMFNQVSYGFSDYFSVGTGLIPLFLFAGTPSPVWITPKFSIPLKKDKFNLGAGALAATVIGEDQLSFGIAYGTMTYGSRDRNGTLGAGWTYTTDGFGEYPTFSFSGMYRIGKKGYLLTENYLISTQDQTIGIISAGGRTVQKRLAVDYGLFIPLGVGEFFALPWLSITLPFGGNTP